MQGKVIMLEFWATWCGPCIPAMEHLNEIKNQFSDEELAVIAISNEDAEPVKRFLENKPVDFYVALDKNEETFNIYQPLVIPHTVVINPEGVIAAITTPDSVRKEHIQALLKGNSINLPVKKYGSSVSLDQKLMEQKMEKQDANTLYKLILRESESASAWLKPNYANDSTSVNYHNRRITGKGVWPLALFAYAFDFPNNRIIDTYGLPEKGYYMDIILPQADPAKLKKTMRKLLTNSFQITTKKETREMEGFRLQKIPDKELKLEKSQAEKPFYTMRGPTMEAKKKPIKTLVDYLNNFTGDRPVVDETDLQGLYDYALEWTFSDRQSLHQALNELGLELVKDTVSMDVLVLSK